MGNFTKKKTFQLILYNIIIIFRFVSQMIKQAQSKTSVPTAALVETYARLLVYTEIESLGIKGFLCKFLLVILYRLMVINIFHFSTIITICL